MNCPLCTDTVLDVTYHGGIEVDICPRCRGIWLDRGELERLLADRPPVQTATDRRRADPDERSNDAEQGEKSKKSKKKDRKKRFADRLGDVFEEVLDL